jgi:flagellar M-ring protein FliF
MAEETTNTPTAQPSVAGQWMETVQGMSPARRMTLGGAGLAVIIAFAMIIGGSDITGNWKIVAQGMGPEDQQAAIIALSTKGIEYKLGEMGAIMVPSDMIHDARLELAVSAMPSGHSVGFELFNESDLGRSAFAEKVNFHRALEGELERTIAHLQPVKRARVHLVMPDRALFEDDVVDPSASVMVALMPGKSLSPAQVKAIRHLVSAGVERLSPRKVAVIDETGAMLARPEDDELAMEGSFERQAQLERGLERRIVKLLEPVVGVGGVRAQVSARLDFSRTVETEEKFDPDSQVARSEREKNEKNESDSRPSEGAPGGAANLPDRSAGSNSLAKTANSENNDRVVNYEIDRITRRVENPTPRVDRLSVAVVVDGARSLDENGDVVRTPRTEEEMESYRRIVAKAIGFDKARGDQIEVAHVLFVQPAIPADLGDPLEEGLTLSNPAILGGAGARSKKSAVSRLLQRKTSEGSRSDAIWPIE